jgi:hypothetical protein
MASLQEGCSVGRSPWHAVINVWTSNGAVMDNSNTQPDRQPKAEWKAPELQRLDVNTGTEVAFSGPASPDGNWGQGAAS